MSDANLRDAWNRLQEIVQNEYAGCDRLKSAMNDVAGAIAAEIVCRPATLSQEAVRDEALEALEEGYAVLADITNQWEGRHTLAGQRLLCKMRDAIADATGRSAEDVQDNPIALKREPNAAEPGASDE